MKKIIMTITSVVLLTTMVFAQTTSMNITYHFTAPTTGSLVDYYIVQSSESGTTWTTLSIRPTTNSFSINVPVGINVQVRVAGVDAQGRQGPWSVASDPFVPDAGAPGAPGKPVMQE